MTEKLERKSKGTYPSAAFRSLMEQAFNSADPVTLPCDDLTQALRIRKRMYSMRRWMQTHFDEQAPMAESLEFAARDNPPRIIVRLRNSELDDLMTKQGLPRDSYFRHQIKQAEMPVSHHTKTFDPTEVDDEEVQNFLNQLNKKG